MSTGVSLQELQKVIKYLQDERYEMIYINKAMGKEIINLINSMKLYNELLEEKIKNITDYLDMCKRLALIDKKVILSISTLESLIKGSD